MSNSNTPLKTVCVAIREPLSAQLIIKYIEGKKGIKEIINPKDYAGLLKFAETQGNKFLILDTAFYGIKSFSDVKNTLAIINPQTTTLLCPDNDVILLSNLVTLNCKGYILKNAECHIMQHAFKIIFQDIDYMQTAISKITSSINAGHFIYNNIRFTSQEYKVLMLIKEGNKRAVIALKLAITVLTVDDYRKSINKKVAAEGYKNVDDFLSRS